MPIPKLAAKFETVLSTGIDYSAASMTLATIMSKDLVVLPAGLYGFVIDEGTTDEEYLIGTCDGATSVITSMTRGLSYLDGQTSIPALAKSHRKGAQVKITDHPALILMYSRSLVWQGAYSGATAYSPKDAVTYNNASYICKLSSTGNLPTNSTYWDVLAAKGADAAGSVTPGALGNVLTSDGAGNWLSQAPVSGARCRVEWNTPSSVGTSLAKIPFDTEAYDLYNEYDATTNKRFTAVSAGYYLVTATVTDNQQRCPRISIQKNGVDYAIAGNENYSANYKTTVIVSAVVYMNGTTDYLEIWGMGQFVAFTPLSAAGEKPCLTINKI